jgi:hypothetical protein
MSDIKAGDLVMVVRVTHEHAMSAMGIPFVVSELSSGCICRECWAPLLEPTAMRSSGDAVPVSWLIKIDPPALPESTERKKELTV